MGVPKVRFVFFSLTKIRLHFSVWPSADQAWQDRELQTTNYPKSSHGLHRFALLEAWDAPAEYRLPLDSANSSALFWPSVYGHDEECIKTCNQVLLFSLRCLGILGRSLPCCLLLFFLCFAGSAVTDRVRCSAKRPLIFLSWPFPAYALSLSYNVKSKVAHERKQHCCQSAHSHSRYASLVTTSYSFLCTDSSAGKKMGRD